MFRKQPKLTDSLTTIIQGKCESLRNYIDRFIKEVMLFQGAYKRMKAFLLKHGLWKGSKFHQKGLTKYDLSFRKLLALARNYIKYVDKVKVVEEKREGRTASLNKISFEGTDICWWNSPNTPPWMLQVLWTRERDIEIRDWVFMKVYALSF